MPTQVTMGATLKCNQGLLPSKLIIAPMKRVFVDGMPAATVMDKIPIVNIPPFGMCRSGGNPQVVAATAAAMGTLTPVPCIPIVPAPWSPGAKKSKIANASCLTQNSKCVCVYGGAITIIKPGGKTTEVA